MEVATERLVDLARYNGMVTVTNPKTGRHRTFLIATARQGMLEGSRVVSMLNGPDNTADFVGFGFVTDTGKIRVWKRHRNTAFEKHANILQNAEVFAEQMGLVFQFSVTCRRCNRELTDPESIATGVGPICREKM